MTLNFPLVLVLAVLICGLLALFDWFYLGPRRRAAIAAFKASTKVTDDSQVPEQLRKQPMLVEMGKSFFPVLFIVLVLRSFIAEPFQIPSGSMIPTLAIGDFILVNKFAYGIRLPVINKKIIRIGNPQRGDVMVFRMPLEPSKDYIKRVIGVPGDTLRYTEDKQLFVNGEPVTRILVGEEPGSLGSAKIYKEKLGTVEHLIRLQMQSMNIQPGGEWHVPAGYYFMMGDNRDNSYDSRFWPSPGAPELAGMVPDKDIVGKAWLIWMTWPAPKFEHLPSFSRVGHI